MVPFALPALTSWKRSTTIWTISRHSVMAPIPGQMNEFVRCPVPLMRGPNEKTVRTDIAACKSLAYWPNDGVPDHLANDTEVLLGERMLVHERVHCREDVCRGCR